jgi:prepilin-type N-terminal cleavage/methylation domain-containing protein
MTSFTARARWQSEAGFSLVEMLTVMVILGIVMTGLVNVFVSGERASADGQARLTSQQNVNVALTRLEYDARCASSASLLNKTGSNGAGVYLSLPAQCSHSTGNVAWCVSSGTLVRIAGTACGGTGVNLVSSVTTTTPFSCYTPAITGALPQLKVALTVNSGGTSDATSATDFITMRNNSTASCS